MRSRLNYRLAAFSLIELSVVLVIVGVLMGAIFKGQDLLDVAKVRSVVHDFQHIKVAIHNYQDTYGTLPGDDSNAETVLAAALVKVMEMALLKQQKVLMSGYI
jgi:prepilin-type N-terminal cleavage/methylation domain-containing protein